MIWDWTVQKYQHLIISIDLHQSASVTSNSPSNNLCWLVVWTPLKNISHLGWLFPIYGNKNMFQTTNRFDDLQSRDQPNKHGNIVKNTCSKNIPPQKKNYLTIKYGVRKHLEIAIVRETWISAFDGFSVQRCSSPHGYSVFTNRGTVDIISSFMSHSQIIHVWYIYIHLPHKWPKCR